MSLKWKPKQLLFAVRVLAIYFMLFFGARIFFAWYVFSDDITSSLIGEATWVSLFVALFFLFFSKGTVIRNPFTDRADNKQTISEV
jgi:hypothetical protein